MNVWGFVGLTLALAGTALGDDLPAWQLTVPESRSLNLRAPGDFFPARSQPSTPPPTVTDDPSLLETWHVSLDDIIREALVHSQAIRVIQGQTAGNSGRSLYDVAIANTQIDDRRGRFDPQLILSTTETHNESPIYNSFSGSVFGYSSDTTISQLRVSKTNAFGGTSSLSANEFSLSSQQNAFGLNPQSQNSVGLGYSQPLLQGAGRKANLAPIIIARIDTERSYFDMVDSLQELVRGTIETYWGLMSARADQWAREQQVEQGRFAAALARGRKDVGLADTSEASQAELALANFEAALIAARANVFQREALLRNLIGLPPGDWRQIVPTTPPRTDFSRPDWYALLDLAEQSRPDICQLKLILEADQQNLLIARNQQLPRVDTNFIYRWNGLDGELRDGTPISASGEFTGWTASINFSVPLGLRQARANVRNRELILARDRANLQQGLHSASHRIAIRYRQLTQAHAQYTAFRNVRTIARLNLEQQVTAHRVGRAIFLNVLQAITDWGNAVRQEADALALYNAELAGLDRELGTILLEHGVMMLEERERFIGPFLKKVEYPVSTPPSINADRYGGGSEPSERAVVPAPLMDSGPPIPPIPSLPTPDRGVQPAKGDAAPIDQVHYELRPVDEIFRLWYHISGEE